MERKKCSLYCTGTLQTIENVTTKTDLRKYNLKLIGCFELQFKNPNPDRDFAVFLLQLFWDSDEQGRISRPARNMRVTFKESEKQRKKRGRPPGEILCLSFSCTVYIVTRLQYCTLHLIQIMVLEVSIISNYTKSCVCVSDS